MIVYASRTGNVRSVISRLENIRSVDIKDIDYIDEPYLIFTYTDGIGSIPPHVEEFLAVNSRYLRGVIASGNMNFGRAYCLSADKISDKYDVPVVAKIELRGTKADIAKIKNFYKEMFKGKGDNNWSI